MTTFSALKKRIRAIYGTQAHFAHALGINPATLNARLTGRRDFTREEIEKACALLLIPLAEAHLYFFS